MSAVESCPVCGSPEAVITLGRPMEADEVGSPVRVIGWHTAASGRGCWIVGYSASFAQAVARIREQGGEQFRLAAHP